MSGHRTQKEDVPAARVIEEAFFLYRDAGLRLPPVPRELVDRLEEQAKWQYATAPVSLDDFGRFFAAASGPDPAPLVAFGRAGHGLVSQYFCYQLLRGPLAVFIRRHFGSPYEDTAAELAGLNAMMIEIENLVVAADEAQARGKIGAGQRLLIMIDDVEGTGWQLLGPNGTGWHAGTAPIVEAAAFLAGSA
jgi:hypothetical protein